MDYSKLLPHLFAASSLIEAQLKKLDQHSDRFLISDEVELKGIRSSHKQLAKTANLLQLSIAKNELLESFRLVSVYYGLLYIIRPSLTRLIEQYANSAPCAVLVKAISEQHVTMH